MAGDGQFEPERFAEAFQRFLDWVPMALDRPQTFAARLEDHFGTDASTFPATKLQIAEYDRPNVQVALDAYLAQPDRSSELFGFAGQQGGYMQPRSRSWWRGAARRGASRKGPSGGRWSSSKRGARWRV